MINIVNAAQRVKSELVQCKEVTPLMHGWYAQLDWRDVERLADFVLEFQAAFEAQGRNEAIQEDAGEPDS